MRCVGRSYILPILSKGIQMLLRVIFATLLISMSLSSFARSNNLSVSLSVSDRATLSDQEVMVDVVFTNNGSTSLSIPKWFVPDGELEGNLFLLSRDGSRVPYLGPIIKRAAPTAQDMISLAPGESITRSVDIAGMYDLSASGEYKMQYGVASSQLFGRTNPRQTSDLLKRNVEQMEQTVNLGMETLMSNEVATWVEGRSNPLANLAEDKSALFGAKSSIAYSGRCSATQQSTLTSAVAAASSMANDSVSYMSRLTTSTPRFTTWFGAATSAAISEIRADYANIKDALDNKPLVLDCSCKKSYYAYVYPTQPYKVYLCRAFWTAPLTGTDSKGGTLIHELSHFNVIAGTNDYAYGQTAAKALAISNPQQARDNADSHEYFSENTPALQ
jgi:peptidyl-Lys metalloendopeptidase